MKDVPTTNSNTTESVSTLVQSELSPQMDTVPENATQKVTSWITSVTQHAQSDSTTELTSHVLPNAQLDTSKMLKSVNSYHKTALQVNSITLKMASVPLVPTPVLNANMLTTIAQPVPLASHSSPVNVLNPTLVELENTEMLQVHVELAQPSVLNVSVPPNVPLAPLDSSTTVLIVS